MNRIKTIFLAVRESERIRHIYALDNKVSNYFHNEKYNDLLPPIIGSALKIRFCFKDW